MRIDYRLGDKFDIPLFASILTLVLFGLAAIYSSTQNTPAARGNFDKQLVSFGVALLVFFFVYSIPGSWFRTLAVPAYSFAMLLLVAVLIIGRNINGAKAWIWIGGASFQPSEFAKLAAILMIAHYLTRGKTDINNIKDLAITLALGFAPVALILLEPDLGSVFVFIGMMITLLFWQGITLFGMFAVLSPGLVAVAALFGQVYLYIAIGTMVAALILFRRDVFLSGSILALNIGAGFSVDNLYAILSPHQQKRILSFIDPGADPLGAGYNSIQARIAIGSGGLFGKGFLHGNQTQLQFIPEQWTDFIFCVIGEEFGFIGSILVICLFAFAFYRILRLASSAKNEFFSIVLVGILSVYFIHFVINIGMAIGILPVIGIPLPFISYGGSSLLINMTMLGIVFNVYRTRKTYD